jgi:putative CocE/NonD family hydrolase
VESREDVLVYTTSPLTADVEVTGPVLVTLYAASSAVDTDFTAKLVDVHPSGFAQNLTDGIIRARYRHSAVRPEPIEPGRVYAYTIDLWATSNVFKAGHRIRLEISSSNFPRFDRNPNTGGALATETELLPAIQTIHHNGTYPSHVTLPIIPRA